MSESFGRVRFFLGELKRRRVYRVAVVYALVGLAVVEAADIILPRLLLPEWSVTLVLALVLAGFPFALVLAWAFDITPDGVMREVGTTAQRGISPWFPAVGTASVVLLIVAAGWWLDAPRDKAASIQSGLSREERIRIAVLPFRSISTDPGDKPFTEGIHEETLNQLGKIGGLRVTSRTSVVGYAEDPPPIPRIARELGVDYVVEGTVRRGGKDVRITAKLIDPRTDEPIRTKTFNREYSAANLFDVQTRLARNIAEALAVTLTSDEAEELAKRPTDNIEAYESYLTGRFYWNKRTAEAIATAIDYFRQALELDPGYAAAYAGLADCYVLGPIFGLPPRESIPQAKSAARSALELDDGSAKAHAALGYALALYDWDWERAEQEFQRALELNPSDATARFHYAAHLAAQGRTLQAIKQAEQAHELDPVSPIIRAGVAWMFYFARRHEDALEQSRKLLELHPDFAIGHHRLGMAYLHLGMYEEATAALQEAVANSGQNPSDIAALGYAYAVSGDRAQAEKMMDELIALSEKVYVPAYSIASVHAGLGDTDSAFQWLHKAYDERSWNLAFIKVDPRMDTLRSDPRFYELLRRMGLEP